MSTIKMKIIKGDTFYGIADSLSVSRMTLKLMNPQITDVNKIYVGAYLNVPDTQINRTIIAQRERNLSSTNIPDANGDWGAYPKQPITDVSTSQPMELDVTGAGAAWWQNPYVLSGLAFLGVLLMDKKGRK